MTPRTARACADAAGRGEATPSPSGEDVILAAGLSGAGAIDRAERMGRGSDR